MSEWNDDDRVVLTERGATPEVIIATSRRTINATFRVIMTREGAAVAIHDHDASDCKCEACRDNVV